MAVATPSENSRTTDAENSPLRSHCARFSGFWKGEDGGEAIFSAVAYQKPEFFRKHADQTLLHLRRLTRPPRRTSPGCTGIA
jgi:hypothetical protein